MARLPDVDPDAPDADADLIATLRARRGGRLLNLDLQLLHSAPLARGWNACFGAIRSDFALDGRLRELAILLVAVLNRAPYEFFQHEPSARAEGVTQAQIDALPAWRDSQAFAPLERDVLAYAEAMTLQVQVADDVFDALRARLGRREIVELTATIAGYNMVSRFLEALRVEPEVG